MKKSLQCLFGFLAMSFVFSASAYAGPAFEDWTEDGIIVDASVEKIGQYTISKEDDGQIDWGERIEGIMHSMLHSDNPSIRLLDGGYYVVYGGEGVNCVGLFDENGEQLIPFEAALIKYLGNSTGEDTGRYLSVYYATEQTDDRKKALLFLSDGSWIGGNLPSDGDVMYEGYIRFYDLKLRRFVPDLTGAEVNSSCDNLLILEDSHTGRKIYDEEGRLVAEKWKAGNGYLIRNQSPYEVYDTSLELHYTTEKYVEGMLSTSGYLKQKVSDQGWQVIDIDGNPVVPALFSSIIHEKYGIICGADTDGENVLVRTDGQILAKSKTPIRDLSAGYYYIEEDGVFTLVGYDGIIVETPNRPQLNLQVFDKESGIDAHTLVLNTREYSLPFSRGWDLGIGLMGGYSHDTKKYGVIDLFTGEELLPCEYDKVYASGGLIYAQAGSICDVYRPRWQYR